MKQQTLFKAAIFSLVLTTILAAPADAARGGRISSGGFRSSPSRTSAPSYPSRSTSYPSYSGGGSVAPSLPPSYPRRSTSYPSYSGGDSVAPSRPRRYYDDDVRPSAPIIAPIIIPSAPALPALPAPPAPPVAAPAPVPSTAKPSAPEPSAKPSEESPNPALTLIVLMVAAGFCLYILIPKDLLSKFQEEKGSKTSLVKLQVALLASAKDLQQDLIKLAEEGDTYNYTGLAKILQDTTLALLRHPDKVVYAWSEKKTGTLSEIEPLFNATAMEERAKVSEEVLSSVSGKLSGKRRSNAGASQGEYILVSILVAVDGQISIGPSRSFPELKSNLVSIGAVSPENLLALEIIWQPEDSSEVLTKEELLSLYSNLNSL